MSPALVSRCGRCHRGEILHLSPKWWGGGIASRGTQSGEPFKWKWMCVATQRAEGLDQGGSGCRCGPASFYLPGASTGEATWVRPPALLLPPSRVNFASCCLCWARSRDWQRAPGAGTAPATSPGGRVFADRNSSGHTGVTGAARELPLTAHE